ncbi:Tryptophan--tRNA ligase [Candidatus Annandia adelgestsuga]|uniref:Tryptophan--tRNA ligase n=1 Tax=Candidatus Annandia adelgestsuga TaxID=1302411 RepID=A0A3Q9CLQ2_9ENTR|nr:tryptophan--tRNA ligase [Candidatus Annandia adelgestsuga]AZP36285.1 Tryptophan--tRNA ligase [Candidatus Annandia adelgestsuga]
MKKSIVFSAIQPSGVITLGNYIGVLKNWKILQNNYNCIYCIADMHSITNKINPKLFKKNIMDNVALYLSCNINPKKSIIFIQSHVKYHTQLCWILNCFTYLGELTRMTQFKSKIKNIFNKINLGLLNYPILMASDILLYQTNKVPVGKDQIQHLELSKKIAKRFNKIYNKKIFNIPEPLLNNGNKIMSLSNPKKKMSKSDINKNSFISLLDDPKKIHKKIKKSFTDIDNPPKIYYDIKKKPGISNLLLILSNLTGKKMSIIEKEFENQNYSYLKINVINYITDTISDIQHNFNIYKKNKDFLEYILKYGSKKASKYAKKTIEKVYNVIGLYYL